MESSSSRSALLLTVVVPTHNRPGMLQAALQSLAQQSCRRFEVVVVDDGSEPPVQIDESTLEGRAPIRVIRHEVPAGGHTAKNAGARAATGRLVTFLDDDDLVVPQFVERVLWVFAEHPALDVLFVPVATFGRDEKMFQEGCDEAVERLIAAAPNPPHDRIVWLDQSVVPALLTGVPMALQRPVFRVPAFGQIGGFLPCKTMWECEWAIRAVSCLQTALLMDRLHLWRVDGQGYFTNGPRVIDQAEANVQIKRRLFEDRSILLPRERQHWFRTGLADAWFTLACQRLMIERDATASAYALLRSLATEFSWKRLRLIGRIAVNMVGGDQTDR